MLRKQAFLPSRHLEHGDKRPERNMKNCKGNEKGNPWETLSRCTSLVSLSRLNDSKVTVKQEVPAEKTVGQEGRREEQVSKGGLPLRVGVNPWVWKTSTDGPDGENAVAIESFEVRSLDRNESESVKFVLENILDCVVITDDV